LADTPLNEITNEIASDFAAHRLREGMQVSTANNSLRVLRRILNLAVEWGALDSAAKIRILSGERRRERVVTAEEEAKYLAAAPEPLASIASVLADTGLRPEECFRLCWEHVTWHHGRHGALLVMRGKTVAARRVIPMTPRVRAVLDACWSNARKPDEGWVWLAATRSGHVEPSSLRKQHSKTFETIADEASKRKASASIRSVLAPAYVSDATWAIRVRCLDASKDSGARLNQHFGSVRPSVRRRCARCHVKAGWAQNWAQKCGVNPSVETVWIGTLAV
jgi:integrase